METFGSIVIRSDNSQKRTERSLFVIPKANFEYYFLFFTLALVCAVMLYAGSGLYFALIMAVFYAPFYVVSSLASKRLPSAVLRILVFVTSFVIVTLLFNLLVANGANSSSGAVGNEEYIHGQITPYGVRVHLLLYGGVALFLISLKEIARWQLVRRNV